MACDHGGDGSSKTPRGKGYDSKGNVGAKVHVSTE